jgi:ADP-ribose pyrophosphatase YjhB (NUDIX family)
VTGPQAPWLDWARQLQAIAQTGAAYDAHPYHAERYERVGRIAAEMMAAGLGEHVQAIENSFAGERGHATPKVDVRAAAFRGEELLLVRERMTGLWTLPGGWADPGEAPAESAVREAQEESGYSLRATKLVALHDRERRDYGPVRWYTYKVTFLCELLPGEPREHDHEVLEVGFFGEHGLPALDLNRTAPQLVGLCFAHLRDRSLPTDFD